MRRTAFLALLLFAASHWGCAGSAPHGVATAPTTAADRVTLVAEAAWTTGMRLGDLEIGGLSGLAYDPSTDELLAVSDDPHNHPPARLLRLRWRPPAAPVPLGWIVLTANDGSPLPLDDADLEGVAIAPDGQLLVSSEGHVAAGRGPWVGRFDRSGRLLGRLRLPAWYSPGPGVGPRPNAALEGLGIDGPGGAVWAGMEMPLLQDDLAGVGDEGERRVRLLRWQVTPDAWEGPREWLYPIDPPHARPLVPGELVVAGLVDVVPWRQDTLLALERSFVLGRGFRLRLYEVQLAGAEEVTGREALGDQRPRVAGKRLVADLGELGAADDNFEGLTWGPRGADGRRLLYVVCDNNFRDDEKTWLLALAIPGD